MVEKKLKRNLGKMGEDILSLWAHEVGMTINPSVEDNTGWDYLLEFKPNPETNITPYDLTPPPISCLFQVKTTLKKNLSRISIKLSNWERLVKNPLPVFFLILYINEETNTPKQAYLVHVGEEWIYKILKRLREIPETNFLNKKTLDLTWKSSELLATLTGQELQNSIKGYIGKGLDKYIEEKILTLNNIGGKIKALWKISKEYSTRDEFFKEWVDFAIGVKNSITVKTLVRDVDIRFGIPANSEIYKGGIIEFKEK